MRSADGIRSFHPDDLRRLDQILGSYVRDTSARCAVLMDRTGRLLTTAGETAGIDGVTFASLAAADFSASDQLAMILGEDEFTTLFHQGDRLSMYLAAVGGQAILATLFDQRTTLGMVRLRLRAAEPQFGALFAEIAARDATPGAALEPDWADEAADQVDRLFAD